MNGQKSWKRTNIDTDVWFVPKALSAFWIVYTTKTFAVQNSALKRMHVTEEWNSGRIIKNWQLGGSVIRLIHQFVIHFAKGDSVTNPFRKFWAQNYIYKKNYLQYAELCYTLQNDLKWFNVSSGSQFFYNVPLLFICQRFNR